MSKLLSRDEDLFKARKSRLRRHESRRAAKALKTKTMHPEKAGVIDGKDQHSALTSQTSTGTNVLPSSLPSDSDSDSTSSLSEEELKWRISTDAIPIQADYYSHYSETNPYYRCIPEISPWVKKKKHTHVQGHDNLHRATATTFPSSSSSTSLLSGSPALDEASKLPILKYLPLSQRIYAVSYNPYFLCGSLDTTPQTSSSSSSSTGLPLEVETRPSRQPSLSLSSTGRSIFVSLDDIPTSPTPPLHHPGPLQPTAATSSSPAPTGIRSLLNRQATLHRQLSLYRKMSISALTQSEADRLNMSFLLLHGKWLKHPMLTLTKILSVRCNSQTTFGPSYPEQTQYILLCYNSILIALIYVSLFLSTNLCIISPTSISRSERSS